MGHTFEVSNLEKGSLPRIHHVAGTDPSSEEFFRLIYKQKKLANVFTRYVHQVLSLFSSFKFPL